jgi:DNA-binding GntR family transcriptional regulator
MTGASMTAEAKDTDALIKQWRASTLRVEQIAADLASKIDCGQLHRWNELPPQAELADEYDVTERTVTSVKRLLAVHRFLTQQNRRYYIA